MKLLILSDTHIPIAAKGLPPQVLDEIKRCDAVIHCGDFVSFTFYEQLLQMAKIYSVSGNMDDARLRATLARKQILKFDGIHLALFHGKGAPAALLQRVRDEFADEYDAIDIFVFGHSHQPLDKVIKNKIYFNPGSVTDTVFAPYTSYGILTINGRQLIRRVVKIE